MTFQRLSGCYRQEAVNGYVGTRTSFAWLVSIKCWKPAESLLEMIAKRQNTSMQLRVSFH